MIAVINQVSQFLRGQIVVGVSKTCLTLIRESVFASMLVLPLIEVRIRKPLTVMIRGFPY